MRNILICCLTIANIGMQKELSNDTIKYVKKTESTEKNLKKIKQYMIIVVMITVCITCTVWFLLKKNDTDDMSNVSECDVCNHKID